MGKAPWAHLWREHMPKTVLFDCHHPKHFLVLRAVGERLMAEGVDVVWTCRAKDVLVDLIRQHHSARVLTTPGRGVLGLAQELVTYDLKLLGVARQVKPTVMAGNSISIAHVGAITGIPSIILNDDDAKANKQYPLLGYPFARRILTPDCLAENHGAKHRKYPSYHELAYLHPTIFRPDEAIFDELGLASGAPYFLVRFVSLQASHDFREEGITFERKLDLVRRLEARGPVFVSVEGPMAPELERNRLRLPPHRMHHVLAFARLYVGDSQTMAAEAAVLGTPSLRCNTFVGRLSYLEELEHRYQLTFGFLPSQFSDLLRTLDDILGAADAKASWAERRARMLADKIDPTDFYHEQITSFL
jgi:predicted glycosyltransferase